MNLTTDQILANLEFRIRRTEAAMEILEAEVVKLRAEVSDNMRHVPTRIPRNPIIRHRAGVGIPGNQI